MPIHGRSLGEASRIFVDHLNDVLHKTVTQMPLSFEVVGPTANIRFRRGTESAPARLQTRYGRMGLYVGQLCDSVEDAQRVHTLRTTNYRYALLPEGDSEPFLRWEFVRTPAVGANYCRHHIQGPIRLGISDSQRVEARLQDWHLPTGWVPIEEIIRFCIADLGVVPLNDAWSDILRTSEQSGN